MLSVDGFHVSAIEVGFTADATRPTGAEGAMVSGHVNVSAVTVVRADTLPAASNASTPTL